jgi:hypothetical protein
VFTERQFDFTILRPINVIGFKGLHERRRLREPRLEIGNSPTGSSTKAAISFSPP